MFTSQSVKPGCVWPAVFLYHFSRGSLHWSFCCSNQEYLPSNKGTSPHDTTTGSRTGVDLEVVFVVGLQSTLLKAHAKSLGSLKTCAAMMRKSSSVDKRPGCGYEVMTRMLVSMMTWCQDKVCRSRIEIMWVDHSSGHMLRSCNKIIWVFTYQNHVIGRSRDHDITDLDFEIIL